MFSMNYIVNYNKPNRIDLWLSTFECKIISLELHFFSYVCVCTCAWRACMCHDVRGHISFLPSCLIQGSSSHIYAWCLPFPADPYQCSITSFIFMRIMENSLELTFPGIDYFSTLFKFVFKYFLIGFYVFLKKIMKSLKICIVTSL